LTASRRFAALLQEAKAPKGSLLSSSSNNPHIIYSYVTKLAHFTTPTTAMAKRKTAQTNKSSVNPLSDARRAQERKDQESPDTTT